MGISLERLKMHDCVLKPAPPKLQQCMQKIMIKNITKPGLAHRDQ